MTSGFLTNEVSLPGESNALRSSWSMVRSGTIAVPIASKHRLEDFAAALADDAQRTRTGKVVLV